MSEIRILFPEDFDELIDVYVSAYPGIKIDDRGRFKELVLKVHEEDPAITFHGLFRAGRLLGIMGLYDFQMNFLGARIPVGGVGQMAVHLAHKKEHVAKEMMGYFLRTYRDRGVPLVVLYPFRPDFYRQMGFGYGTKMNQYRVRPAALPKGHSKEHVRFLADGDKQGVADCYHRCAHRTHGMMDKSERELRRLFGNPEQCLVGYDRDGQIRGYLAFGWERGDSFITNDLHVKELIYETHEALSELLTFLHSQADQIRHVIVNTQDEYFHHLLLDPRNDSGRLIPDVYHETNAQGVGLMYRVVDVAGMFDRLVGRDFGGQTCSLKLTVADSFLPENAGSTLLRFDNGCARRVEDGPHDVEVSLSIEDFSSLLAGTVDLKSLCRYGLAGMSNPVCVDQVNRIFGVEQKPVCTTSF